MSHQKTVTTPLADFTAQPRFKTEVKPKLQSKLNYSQYAGNRPDSDKDANEEESKAGVYPLGSKSITCSSNGLSEIEDG